MSNLIDLLQLHSFLVTSFVSVLIHTTPDRAGILIIFFVGLRNVPTVLSVEEKKESAVLS